MEPDGDLRLQWTREKSVREEKIQAMYDALVPIWNRLDLSEEEREAFINEHRGLSDDVIAAVSNVTNQLVPRALLK